MSCGEDPSATGSRGSGVCGSRLAGAGLLSLLLLMLFGIFGVRRRSFAVIKVFGNSSFCCRILVLLSSRRRLWWWLQWWLQG